MRFPVQVAKSRRYDIDIRLSLVASARFKELAEVALVWRDRHMSLCVISHPKFRDLLTVGGRRCQLFTRSLSSRVKVRKGAEVDTRPNVIRCRCCNGYGCESEVGDEGGGEHFDYRRTKSGIGSLSIRWLYKRMGVCVC